MTLDDEEFLWIIGGFRNGTRLKVFVNALKFHSDIESELIAKLDNLHFNGLVL